MLESARRFGMLPGFFGGTSVVKRQSLQMSAIGVALACAMTTAARPSESITYTYDALGRLVVAQSDGTVNDNQTHSLCFDPAGNRTKYRADDAGALPSCAPTPSPMPSPTAPAMPTSNTAPTAVSDSNNMSCGQTKLINVIANDADADGDTPLMLTGASVVSGIGSAAVASGTEVSVLYGSGSPWGCGNLTISYQVTDARGAASTGQLSVF